MAYLYDLFDLLGRVVGTTETLKGGVFVEGVNPRQCVFKRNACIGRMYKQDVDLHTLASLIFPLTAHEEHT